MTFNNRLGCLTPIVAALIVVIGSSTPASAATCNDDLGACYQQAAGAGGYWATWTAALDCDLAYGGCVREAGFGF